MTDKLTPTQTARVTLGRILKWREPILEHAKNEQLPPAVIAAIIVRETSALDLFMLPPPKGKLGDGGFGAGPMQIDLRSYPEWHKNWASGTLTVSDGIKKGCAVLSEKIEEIERSFPDITPDQVLKRAVAAYNCGSGNVRKAFRKGKNEDYFTTHKDYSSSVMEMAEFFKQNGFV